MDSRRNDTFFYTLVAEATTNFPGSQAVSFIDSRYGTALVIGRFINIVTEKYIRVANGMQLCYQNEPNKGHDGKIQFTFEHHPSWSHRSLDEHVPVDIAVRHIKLMIDPFQVEMHKIRSFEGWQSK
jgi:hypothetical protein